jgi:hypothetical protein
LQSGDLSDEEGMVKAAQPAVALHDLDIAAELARAVVDAGGGFDARQPHGATPNASLSEFG